MKPVKFESGVLEVMNLSPSVKNIKLWVSEDFSFIPGQYVSLIITKDNKKFRRPYSISSPPSEKGYIDLCIKIVENGIITPLINEFQENDEVTILGPLGEFTMKNKDKDIVFISSGSGIGPFRSMIRDLLENNFENKIHLLVGYKNEEEILYNNEFFELSNKHENFEYDLILSQPSPNYEEKIGRVQNLIQDFTPPKEADYYLCGLNDMILSIRSLLIKKGVLMKDIYSEKYD